MATPRSDGSSSFMRLPPMKISPSLTSSRPAIILSSVDFPQPDGPTKTTNSPSSMASDTPWMTSVSPKDLRTVRSSIWGMGQSAFHRANGDAGDDLALEYDVDEDDGGRGEHDTGRKQWHIGGVFAAQ